MATDSQGTNEQEVDENEALHGRIDGLERRVDVLAFVFKELLYLTRAMSANLGDVDAAIAVIVGEKPVAAAPKAPAAPESEGGPNA